MRMTHQAAGRGTYAHEWHHRYTILHTHTQTHTHTYRQTDISWLATLHTSLACVITNYCNVSASTNDGPYSKRPMMCQVRAEHYTVCAPSLGSYTVTTDKRQQLHFKSKNHKVTHSNLYTLITEPQ